MKKVAICAIVKDERRYLAEWIAYHSVIGFDHFFLYDNGSSDTTLAILRRARERGICTFWRCPDFGKLSPQLTAYNHGARRAGAYAWILFLDADEFVNLKRHDSIHEFLADYPDADALWLNWRMFGDNGHATFQPGLVTERFTRASPKLFGPNHLGKTIVRRRALARPFVHTHRLREGATFLDLKRRECKHFPETRQDRVTHGIAQINHYFTKSREEWILKLRRGKASKPADDPERCRAEGEFDVHNRNDELDVTILRYRAAVRDRMQELFGRSVARTPLDNCTPPGP